MADCEAGKIEVTLVRTYGSYASEESYTIYEGEGTTGTIVVPKVQGTGTTTTTTHCMNAGIHTVKMEDSYGDAWSSGSNLNVYIGGELIAVFHLTGNYPNAKLDTGTFTVAAPINQFGYGQNWKYTNEAQTGATWTTQAVTWTEGATFPVVSTTTRYFRRTITIEEFASCYYLQLKVKTSTGFIVYVNGNRVFKYNMPAGEVTSTTYALSKNTEVVERIYGSMLKLWATTATVEVAVEVHATADSVSGDEDFDCAIVIFHQANGRSLVDAEPIISSSHLSTGWEGTAKLFDGSTSTKWCFGHTTGNVWVAHQYRNARRETVNKYRIASGNDMPNRDPRDWTLSGSFDGENWTVLDTQINQVFATRYLYKDYSINNYVPYEYYKLEITAKYGSDYNMQFSEWELLVVPVEGAIPSFDLSYSPASYTLSRDIEEVNIAPQPGPFSDFVIEPALPAGLTLNAGSGVITGIATQAVANQVYNITANNLLTGEATSAQLTLTVIGCDLPSGIATIFSKSNGNVVNESVEVINAQNEVVYTLQGSATAGSTITVAGCLSVGTYTIKMKDSAGTTWDADSFLTITHYVEGATFTVSKTRLRVNTESSFTFDANFPLAFADVNNNIKYLADGSVPANWYATSFSDSAWTSLVHTSRPEVSQKIQLFRTTFSVAALTDIHGYELFVKARAGVIVYLNGNEVYRTYLPAGDLTANTDATGGSETAVWRSVTGKTGHLVSGTNTVAVGVVNLGSAATAIEFNVGLRLMKDSNTHPRYFKFDCEASSNANDKQKAFDLNPSTQLRIAKADGAYIEISFQDRRAEFFNRYCFNTNPSTPDEDPFDWSIQGSNDGQVWDTLKNETAVPFEMRATEYCFFMPTVTKAYNRFRLVPTASGASSANYVAVGDLMFFLENLDAVTIPDLAFAPNDLVGYTNAAFPEVTANSAYYTTFSIEPALPTELVMSRNTGSIKGVPSQPYSATVHTITAVNHLGETKSTTVSVTVNVCTGDLIGFSLVVHLDNNGERLAFDLKELSTGEIVESRAGLVSYQDFTIPMCRAAGHYGLILKKFAITGEPDSTGWGASYVTIRLADGSVLLTESLAAGQSEKQYSFNARYEIAPLYSEWSYLVDGTAAPTGWNTVANAPAWPTAVPGSFPVATGVTQYYYKKFTVEDISEYAILEVSVVTRAGMVVYLNGERIHSMNIETYGMDANTAAESENEVPINYIAGVNVLSGKLVAGENIIGIEMHRYRQNEETNTFDAAAILVLDNMYMIKDGVATSNYPGSSGQDVSKAFDNNVDTNMYVSGHCIDMSLTWTYNNGRREPINKYTVVNANSCNIQTPSGWVLSGSNDNENWADLHTANNKFFTAHKQPINMEFYNENTYNQYRISFTECLNEALADDGYCYAGDFLVSDVYLFSKRVEPDCERVGDYPPAMIGDHSYAECPELYSGTRYMICTAEGLKNETNLCFADAPKGIEYPEKDLLLTQSVAMTPAVPVIIGKEITSNIFPALPDGLSLELSTATISGTPQVISDKKRYTVSIKNAKGSEQTTITIQIVEKPINWVLIGVLAAVAVIVIVVIIIVIVKAVGGKKDKKTMQTQKGKPAGKAAAKAAPAAVKTKTANVKV